MPLMKPPFRRPRPGVRPRVGETPFKPGDVAKAYGFPRLTIPAAAIAPLCCYIELGGGYYPTDFADAARDGNYPAPIVSDVSVQGAVNAPGSDADGEVALDGQVGAAVFAAMTGKAAQVKYVWAPNNGGSGFSAAVLAAVAAIQKNSGLGTISISWGAPEAQWTSSDVAAMESALGAASAAGIPVCVASGDNGSSDGTAGNAVDYPAASVFSIGCGGTSLVKNGDGSLSEVVWNNGVNGGATGGGASSLFNVPAFQQGFAPSGVRGRCVPDVSGDANPETGYLVYVNGQLQPIGGTSAVAPLVAAYLAALQMATQKPLGNVLQTFYANEPAFNDIVSGNNGSESAMKGYDLATGLGSVNGPTLTEVFLKGLVTTPPPPPPPPTGATPPPPVTSVTVNAALSAELAADFARWETQYGKTRSVPPVAFLKALQPAVLAKAEAAVVKAMAG